MKHPQNTGHNTGHNSSHNTAHINELLELHSQAITNFQASMAAERSQRDLCIEDMRFAFVAGSQWSDDATTARNDRPRFEINKIAGPINQIIGEQRQNRISIKVRATKGDASKDMADVLSGLIRNIENDSHFKDIKDNAFKEIVSGGFGAWTIATEWDEEHLFLQNIKIKPIRSAASSVYYDPSSTDELKRDAKWIMVTEDLDRSFFKKKYPDSTAASLSAPSANSYLNEWQTRDTVRVADYWVKEPVVKEFALMSNGETLELNKKTKSVLDELESNGVVIIKKRKKHSEKVVMYKISAAEILEGPFEWAGSSIPVVPVFGYNVWINSQHYYQGMVRMAKDPQRVFNYATSQAIETSALSPKDPYWVTPKQMEGLEGQMASFNIKNTPFMFYNPDADAPGTPQRTGAPSVQTALIQQVQQADLDIQATTGLFAPSLGQNQTDQSGRAILALQRAGNTSTHELVDNLAKAVEYTGKILIELIPKIYDTQRQISVLGEDGSTAPLILNETILDQQTGEPVIINDISVGRYDVISTVGPTFTTQRSEGLNFLTKLSESNPMFSSVATDLIAKSIDFPFAEELTERVRKVMLNQGIVEPTEEEIEKQGPPPEPSLADQMQFKMTQLQLEQQAALVDQIELQNIKIDADTTHKMAQTQERLTNVIETKADINKKLDDQGIPGQFPIDPEEIAARQKNMRLINDAMELTGEDDLAGIENIQASTSSHDVGTSSHEVTGHIPKQ